MKKLTLLNVREGCGESLATGFFWVEYVDGVIDWDDACEEVERRMPWWWPDRKGRAEEFNRRPGPPVE